MNSIRACYEQVLAQIASAAHSAGREPDEVQLVVVTKTHPPETVYEAIAAGACCLGENYAEEAVEKMRTLAAMGVDLSLMQWHMIGHVQSRKAPLIAQYFDLIHSLDSVKLAQRLDHFAHEHLRTLPVFLQLNVSGEESKSGFPAWSESHQKSLAEAVTQMLECKQLTIQGLMTVPPFFDEPEQARPFFRKLRDWRGFLAKEFPEVTWKHLSMGMSGDFEVAIQEGATVVRIGTAILGART